MKGRVAAVVKRALTMTMTSWSWSPSGPQALLSWTSNQEKRENKVASYRTDWNDMNRSVMKLELFVRYL